MSPSSAIRVVIVDDFHLVRQGLRSLLEDAAGIRVVGDADSSNVALKIIARRQPDVVLWAVGIKVAGEPSPTIPIRRQSSNTRVLLLTRQASELGARKARQSGAAGYIHMDCTPERLIQVIRDCARNQSGFAIVSSGPTGENGEHNHSLTRRQLQVLRLAARGYTLLEIAAKLRVSVRTAERHRANLKQLLGIHDSAGLVRYAVRNGLTSETALRVNGK